MAERVKINSNVICNRYMERQMKIKKSLESQIARCQALTSTNSNPFTELLLEQGKGGEPGAKGKHTQWNSPEELLKDKGLEVNRKRI